jgi:polyisoprenoid-binding protein YceI
MKKLFFFSAAVVITAILVTSFNKDESPKNNPVVIHSPSAAQAVTKWTIDKAHSNVKFTVTHMVVSEVDGAFRSFDGTVEHSKPDFSDAKVNFTIDVSSIDTDNERRDGHLKSDDFFNAEKYPQMTFQSTSFKPLGNNKYELVGNLTIRDVTKPVKFDVTYGGTNSSGGNTKAGFKAKATINRFDYNLKWDKATEAGSLVVAKEVDITINAQLNQAK